MRVILALVVTGLMQTVGYTQYGSSGSQAVQSYGSSGSQAAYRYQGWRPFQRLRTSYVPSPLAPALNPYTRISGSWSGPGEYTYIRDDDGRLWPKVQAAPTQVPTDEAQVPACKDGICPLPRAKKIANKLATALFEPCPKSL